MPPAVDQAQAEVRLRLPAHRRWGRGLGLVALGVVGIAVGIAGLTELAAASASGGVGTAGSITTAGKIGFGVVGGVCILLGLWLVRTGVNVARHLASRVPVLLATPAAIRLERPGRKARELARARVATASWEVQPAHHEGEPPLAYLEWMDDGGRTLGTWTVDPVIAAGLPRFLAAIDVELSVVDDELEDDELEDDELEDDEL